MRVILRSASPCQLALFSLVFNYSVSLNFGTICTGPYGSLVFYVASRFLLVFVLSGFILLVWPYNPKGDAIAWVGVTRSLFFQLLVVSGLRVRLWRVLRITVTVEFFTWVNKVFHGPSWPTRPCLQVLFCVFGCVVEAKYSLSYNITTEIYHQSGCQASPRGRAYISQHISVRQLRFHFTSNHTQSVSHVRRSLITKHIGQCSDKNRKS